MMKYCSFIVLILLLNCNTKKVVDNSKQNTVIKLGDEVIHFDIIDYYRIKKSYADVDEINFSGKDEMKEVIFGNIPFKNTDTLFVNKLDDKYFQKVKWTRSIIIKLQRFMNAVQQNLMLLANKHIEIL